MAQKTHEVRQPRYLPNGAEMAVISTVQGGIAVELFCKDCPANVGRFCQLALEGFYDNLAFHA